MKSVKLICKDMEILIFLTNIQYISDFRLTLRR